MNNNQNIQPGTKVTWYSKNSHVWVDGTVKRERDPGIYSILGNDGSIYYKKLGDGQKGTFKIIESKMLSKKKLLENYIGKIVKQKIGLMKI